MGGGYDDKIKNLLSFLIKENIDVCALQETNKIYLNKIDQKLINLSGFHVQIDYNRLRENKTKGFGNITLINKKWITEMGNEDNKNKIPISNIWYNNNEIAILNVYNDHENQNKNRIKKRIEEISKNKKNAIILGDVNIDLNRSSWQLLENTDLSVLPFQSD